MAFFSKTLTALALAASIALPAQAFAFDDQQKKELGEFIKQYLIENPEIMLDVQDALQKKQQMAQQVKATMAIENNTDRIFDSNDDVTLGNPKGDVTVVEFFDYNCTYCRHALPDMQALLKKDKNVRFVLKEFPILGPESVAAHRVSNAVKLLAPAKYPEFQRTLLGGRGRANEDSAMEVATSLGLKEADIRKSMAENPNDEQVQETYKLATSLGITGTPSYIVGDEAVFGAVGADPLKEKIANMRSCGKATCS